MFELRSAGLNPCYGTGQEGRGGPKKAERKSSTEENSGQNVFACECKQGCNTKVWAGTDALGRCSHCSGD